MRHNDTHLVIPHRRGDYCCSKTSGDANGYTANHATNANIPKHVLLSISESHFEYPCVANTIVLYLGAK